MSEKICLDVIKESLSRLQEVFVKAFASGSSSCGALGIDIGSHAVKIARLESSKDGYKVLGFSVEKVADKNYREALSKAIVRARVLPQERAVVSVAGQGVVSRYVELPMMNRAELDSSMQFEIEKYVPFPLPEVGYDYAVIHEMKDKAKLLVLIAAAKNDLVQKKCQLAQEMNVGLKAVDLDCLALANFTAHIGVERRRGNCFGIINIGKCVASINIFVDDIPFLSRDIFMGGDDVTKKIAETLEVELSEAERLKCDPEVKKAELLSVWEPVLGEMASEVRVSLDYFESRNNKAVEKLYITGGSGRLEGLADFFAHQLSIEAKRLDYVSRLSFDETVDRADFEKNSDLLAVALGLALR